MDNIYGVVLCGGESRRMGRDKGLLDTGDGCWATRMGIKLAPLPVFYSINPQQWGNYSRILPPDQLIIDSTLLPAIQGPLKGLLSLHERFPDKDFLLVACDMQDLDAATLDKVTEAYSRNLPVQGEASPASDHPALSPDHPAPAPDRFDFFVYRDQHFFQPFAGIYTARGLRAIYRQAGEGLLRDASLQTLLKQARTNSLPIENPAAFRNYNTF